jgi:hypothetical protein
MKCKKITLMLTSMLILPMLAELPPSTSPSPLLPSTPQKINEWGISNNVQFILGLTSLSLAYSIRYVDQLQILCKMTGYSCRELTVFLTSQGLALCACSLGIPLADITAKLLPALLISSHVGAPILKLLHADTLAHTLETSMAIKSPFLCMIEQKLITILLGSCVYELMNVF